MSGGSSVTSSTSTGSGTYSEFFAQLLSQLGIHGKTALQDQLALADVVNTEGRNSYYNPFNIEWHTGQGQAWKGVGNFNPQGVQEYASQSAGVSATAAFLQGNSHWQPLVDALHSGSKSAVDKALTDAYTWAPFHTASTNTEQNILASKLGTSSVNVKAHETIGDAVSQTFKPLTSFGDLLKEASKTDFWIRVGFIVLGFFVLLIGIDKLTDGGITGNANATPTETIDVVTGSASGNQRTAIGRTVSGSSRAVRSTGRAAGRGAATAGRTAKTATERNPGKHRPSQVAKHATEAGAAVAE